MSRNRHRQNAADSEVRKEAKQPDDSILVTQSSNVQIGDSNTQGVNVDGIEKVEAPNPWPPPPEPADEQEEVTITPAALPVRLEKELAGYMRRAIFTCGYGVEPGCRQRVEMWADPKGKQIIVEPMPEPTSPWRVHNCPAGRK